MVAEVPTTERPVTGLVKLPEEKYKFNGTPIATNHNSHITLPIIEDYVALHEMAIDILG